MLRNTALSDNYGSVNVGGCLVEDPPNVTTVPSVHFLVRGAGMEDLRVEAGADSAATQQAPIFLRDS